MFGKTFKDHIRPKKRNKIREDSLEDNTIVSAVEGDNTKSTACNNDDSTEITESHPGNLAVKSVAIDSRENMKERVKEKIQNKESIEDYTTVNIVTNQNIGEKAACNDHESIENLQSHPRNLKKQHIS